MDLLHPLNHRFHRLNKRFASSAPQWGQILALDGLLFVVGVIGGNGVVFYNRFQNPPASADPSAECRHCEEARRIMGSPVISTKKCIERSPVPGADGRAPPVAWHLA